MKNWLKLGVMGFVGGVFLTHTIQIVLALRYGYTGLLVSPLLVARIGSSHTALVVQYLLSGLFGIVCSFASMAFRQDHWSYTKQLGIHFVLLVFTLFPIGYFLGWYRLQGANWLLFVGIFIVSYLAIWCGYYIYYKKAVEQINHQLK